MSEQSLDVMQLVQYAQTAFERLPTLGPVAWLYGRDDAKKHLTLADLDWAVQPPLILDQCRLFMKEKMPLGFISWAYVAEDVHQRLLQGNTQLEPHEWKSGEHLWLIDIVTPFGQREDMLIELKSSVLSGNILNVYSA
ncbi:toxin-activating lysine-acyltransferase [Deefgea rivuli]|uniref:toxin-activating lysine-acyltransferase n=1 Tax=Deefgea rivuli TaxID=400948 RepID=UPI00146FC321|nr:toxin-activating lysine-acyltransferase [Deefgea rivuli]